MLKERMTPEELAQETGFSRQTINKWVRKQGWETSPRPGVQGGKARLIHVNQQVRDFLLSATRQSHNAVTIGMIPVENSSESLILSSLREMTEQEQKHFASLLLREGIDGVLRRLGIRNSD
ncbi:YfeC-like transcriptional regulator [Siccibacter colletis]|jgi:transposase|uniref:DNA-binding transcriptional regulator n=1 Tax=Siccibacter colletis TaxID=1505757 RepID=A0ABY6JE03_9ENTR|nr:YfeC-like transcriptional regulator [Siccibacter colletis]UYU30944.1 putative DNA-binding transcriptional regulator [Siccibacter colletis]